MIMHTSCGSDNTAGSWSWRGCIGLLASCSTPLSPSSIIWYQSIARWRSAAGWKGNRRSSHALQTSVHNRDLGRKRNLFLIPPLQLQINSLAQTNKSIPILVLIPQDHFPLPHSPSVRPVLHVVQNSERCYCLFIFFYLFIFIYQ